MNTNTALYTNGEITHTMHRMTHDSGKREQHTTGIVGKDRNTATRTGTKITASQERSLQQQQRRNVQDITGQDMPIVEDNMEYTTPGRKDPPSPVLKNEVVTMHHFSRVQ
ncbi:hypothetical protein V1264_017359 [Littorina saxatilis]|uniref:Uncharacterized protein n=1 Tax=Littorina saxatilis TaxID=31220 RepID=A0AAN9BH88_9CAEN